MTTFTEEDVRRLARLARLELDPSEIERFSQQLGDILAFARQVQGVDTSAVSEEPASQAVPPLRDDARMASLPREEVVSAAAEHDPASGLIKVPRVLGS